MQALTLKDVRYVVDEAFETNPRMIRFESKVDVLETKADLLACDIEDLKVDVKDLKVDVKDLKTDVKDLKTDVKDLKTDVKDLKVSVTALQNEQHRIALTLEDVQSTSNKILEVLSATIRKTETIDVHTTQISHLRNDVDLNNHVLATHIRDADIHGR